MTGAEDESKTWAREEEGTDAVPEKIENFSQLKEVAGLAGSNKVCLFLRCGHTSFEKVFTSGRKSPGQASLCDGPTEKGHNYEFVFRNKVCILRISKQYP